MLTIVNNTYYKYLTELLIFDIDLLFIVDMK